MKRRSNIDLTPLLDVILLLVFGFMFILTTVNTNLEESRQENKQLTNTSNAQIETLTSENAVLKTENNNLKTAIDNQTQSLDMLESATKNYFNINEKQLETIISSQSGSEAGVYLNRYADASDTAYQMIMYELLKAEFYFVEMVIKGDDNRIWINDVSTPIGIDAKDAYDTQSRDDKISEIKNEISSIIDARPGGSSMVFVTLSTDNPNVYHFAWDIAWDAITNLQEKYGAKNYYCAEIFMIREE